jgi:hypothetical protein
MNRDDLHNEIIEDLNDGPSNGQLPQFLNVLTILTFIYTGLTVIMSLYSLSTQADQQRSIDQLRNMPGADFFGGGLADAAQIALDNIYVLQGTAVGVAIFCLIGALLMRKLKKNGYYIYVIASVVGMVVPISIIGLGTMGFAVLLGSVFTIAFIIMYGVNFKYLR